MSWCACIINEKVLVDGRHMVRVLKTEAEGSMVFLTELSLPGFTFFCYGPSLSSKRYFARGGRICLLHSNGNSMSRFLPFSNSLYSRYSFLYATAMTSHVDVRNFSHCDCVVDV